MTRYIYIDSTYKEAFFKDCKKEQQQTLLAIGSFMASPDTDNENGVGKKVILNGVSKEDYKKFTKDSASIVYDNKRQEQWMSYINMFLSTGDMSLVEFEDEGSAKLMATFQSIQKDEDNPQTISNVENDLWQSYILTDILKERCATLEQKYGISFIRPEDDLTQHEPDASFLRREKGYAWEEIIGQRISNAFVVLDQYAFASSGAQEVNIKAILNKLICHKSLVHLTIYTQKGKCEGQNLNLVKNGIFTSLSTVANIQVDVQDTGLEFHDRVILANNQYITIGGGFDVLNQGVTPTGKHKSDKNTTLHVYLNPAISSKSWLRNEYYGYLNAISEKHDKLCQTASHIGNPLPLFNRLMRPITEILP